MRLVRTAVLYALVAAVPMLAASVAVAADCNAEVRPTAKSDQIFADSILKVWAVDVDTQEDCAKVYVDLIVTERLFDGEEITSTGRGWRKVSTHSTTYKVNYRIAKDSTILDWKFKVASCVPCGSE